MHIYSTSTGAVLPETTRVSQALDMVEGDPIRSVPATSPGTDRSDKVSISDAGRALAARENGDDLSSLDPARAGSIRERVLNGAYDTLEVVDAVARRLLVSGDL